MPLSSWEGKGVRKAHNSKLLSALVLALVLELLPAVSTWGQNTGWSGEDAPVALRGLSDKNPAVRREAAAVLARMGQGSWVKTALPTLTAALKDPDVEVRRLAADLLGRLSSPESTVVVPALCAALKDSDSIVRRNAAAALRGFGTKGAEPALIAALKDPDPGVRLQAAYTLGHIGALGPVRVVIKDANGAFRNDGADSAEAKAVVPALCSVLKSADPVFRVEAADALASMRADAKVAVPALANALKDSDVVVRRHAARALENIGPDAKDALPAVIAALKDSDAGVRYSCLSALQKMYCETKTVVTMRCDVKTVVPVLIEALRDPNIQMRTSAAIALGNIGPEAAAATPTLQHVQLNDSDEMVRWDAGVALGKIHVDSVSYLLPALRSPDSNVRLRAVSALGAMPVELKVGLPLLISALKDPDSTVRNRAISVLNVIPHSTASDELPGLSSAIPELIGAQKDPNNTVRAQATSLLGRTGPTERDAVLALITALNDSDGMVRQQAIQALGLIGAETKAAVPALIAVLKDSRSKDGSSAAQALSRIAATSEDTGRSDMLKPLTEAAAAVDPEKYPADAKRIRVALGVLQAIHRGEWIDTLRATIAEHPRTFWVLTIYSILIVLLPFALWMFPFTLWQVNEKLAAFSKVKLPWMNDMSLAHVILIGFFHYHPRVLDAWVSHHLVAVREQFNNIPTVQECKVHVEVPVNLDRDVLTELTPARLEETFSRKRACLLIWGEGGSGKTSLACQIAKWVMSDDNQLRPCLKPMLPVLIEHDLNIDVEKDTALLREVVRGQLKSLTGEDHSPELIRHLLERRRILVIVDGLSELTQMSRRKVMPFDPEFDANAFVVTSRHEEGLDGVRKTVLHPLRIHGNRLSSFMEAYLVQLGKRSLFEDHEFFEGCGKLSAMVGDRDVTVLLAKLYADQMIAAKESTGERLPENIPDLMIEYLNRLNRGEPEWGDRAVHEAAKTTAWMCLQQTYRPIPSKIDTVLDALGGGSVAEQKIKYLEQKLRLVQVIGVGRDRVKFTIDPLAEYLAGLYLVEHLSDREQSWRKFLAEADAILIGSESIRGFLLAVRDCCVAKSTELKVPSFLAGELEKRLAMKPESSQIGAVAVENGKANVSSETSHSG